MPTGKCSAAFTVATPGGGSVNEVLKTLLEADGFADAKVVHLLEKAGGASALEVSGAASASRLGSVPSMSLRAGLADTLGWYRKTSKLAR